MYNSRLLSKIEIDLLDLVIDACFNQEHEDIWHKIIYLLRKLLLIEQKYNIYDKKLFAIVVFLKS